MYKFLVIARTVKIRVCKRLQSRNYHFLKFITTSFSRLVKLYDISINYISSIMNNNTNEEAKQNKYIIIPSNYNTYFKFFTLKINSLLYDFLRNVMVSPIS